MITGLFESSIFPSCVCRYQGFSGDPQVIPTLVAYKGTHFSVYNIKMLRKNLSTEEALIIHGAHGGHGWLGVRRNLNGYFGVARAQEILEEIFN